MIQAVLFDLGGTLHTTSFSRERELWFAKRLLDRLGDYGVPLPDGPDALAFRLRENGEVYKRAVEGTLRELPPAQIWSEYYLRDYHIPPERLAPIAEELSFLYDYERPMVMRRPHLTETMEALRAMGLKLGVISNIISLTVVPHFLAEYGLTQFMDCVLTSSATGIRKPSPEIFQIAERQLNLRPEDMAYVGDTVNRDVRGVRAAGWRLAIQIPAASSAHRDVGLEHIKPDYRIADLSELPSIIARENRGDASGRIK